MKFNGYWLSTSTHDAFYLTFAEAKAAAKAYGSPYDTRHDSAPDWISFRLVKVQANLDRTQIARLINEAAGSLQYTDFMVEAGEEWELMPQGKLRRVAE